MPEEANDKPTSVSRRDFLKRTAIGAAAVGFTAASRAPLSAAAVGPNDTIQIGVIGVGGRGGGLCRGLMDRAKDPNNKLQIVAVCDVWDKRTERHIEYGGGTAKGFRDYRELLEMDDIDAIVCGTPDHWHAKISIDAMKAGKDVYCEKPMTLYWEEAKEVAETAEEEDAVFQCGAQSASAGRWRTMGDVVAQGGIGQVIWAQGGYFRNNPSGDWNWTIQDADPKTDLDWDMWLGHKFGLSPRIPYDEERYSRFRKYWDYSGGLATDLLYHSYAHTLIALGPKFPRKVVAAGGQPVHNLGNDNREVPTLFHVLIEYDDESTTHLCSTQESTDGFPDVIRGQFASVSPGDPVVIKPQGPFGDQMMALAETLECYQDAEVITSKDGDKVKLEEIRVKAAPNEDHMSNWLECLRTRELPNLHARLAYQVEVPIALSVISYREGEVARFDAEKEEMDD